MKSSICLLGLALLCSAEESWLRDERDGQIYRTTLVGKQRWMAQNLNFDPGHPGRSWCYGGDSLLCTRYGRLYLWAEAMALAARCDSIPCRPQGKQRGICPQAWHVPTDGEWMELSRFVGSGDSSGAVLKSMSSGFSTWDYPLYHLPNSWGFEALPGGHRHPKGYFEALGYLANWWTASEDCPEGAFRRYLEAGPGPLRNYDFHKRYAFSLRCVQD